MTHEAIPSFDSSKIVLSEVIELRQQAPDNLISLIEEGKLENISHIEDLMPGQVSILAGGEMSACYFIENNAVPLVVKFRHTSVEAEAETLQKWHEAGARVPEVKEYGIVPRTATAGNPTKYLILEAIVDEEGRPAPVAYKYLVKHPEALGAIGDLIGKELAVMHQVKGGQKFGGFSDTWGARRQFEKFSSYVADKLNYYSAFFNEMGFSEKDLQNLIAKVNMIDFPTESSYVHSDMGMHNVLVESSDPLSIRIFDPNPLLCDPYWDIAREKNRVDISKIELDKTPKDKNKRKDYESRLLYFHALADSYKESAKISEFDVDRMKINQLVQLTSFIFYQRKKGGIPVITTVPTKLAEPANAHQALFQHLTTSLIERAEI